MSYSKEGWIRANEYAMFMVKGNAEKIIHLQSDGFFTQVFPHDTARTIRVAKVTPASLLTRRYILVDLNNMCHDYMTGEVKAWR